VATPKKKTPAKTRAPAAEQVARNEEIVAARMRGLSYIQLARTYGLSKQRIQQIHKEYRESNPTLRGHDPVEIVDSMLEGYSADIEELVLISATTQTDAVRVSAINARMAARNKTTELLQELGVLPRDLGQLSVAVDAKMTAVRILSVLKQHNVPGEVLDAMLYALEEGSVEGEATEVEDE
jgi:hypothetical protein